MAETDGGSTAPATIPAPALRQVPPRITLPPPSSFETLFTGGPGPGFSPGPMTLVSNFFSDHYSDVDCRSFSQLLAGAMASPAAQIAPVSMFDDSKQSDSDKKLGGFKQMDLVIAPSPTGFMFPSVLSPSGLLNSPGFFSPLQSPLVSHQQALAHVTAQAALSQSYFNHFQPEQKPSALASTHQESQINPSRSDLEDSQIESSDNLSISHSDIGESQHIVSVPVDTNDGYNWRKYGQKQVKASEHPRSYYKCTHMNCPVKKKVGQALDGHISDIVYKGRHNHEPPQNSKRAKETGDVSRPNGSQLETRVAQERVDVVDHGSNQLVILDDPDDEPNPKRRNTEVGHVAGPVDTSSAQKTVTEAKIVVQTRSEVDLLDDGFKWRKYGQKVVKGNTNPRSYYKCTYAGCNVRKHVERAPSDPKSVVTTYEGKHNHDIPIARHRAYNTNNTRQQRKETKFENNNDRRVLLQMKEEQITA